MVDTAKLERIVGRTFEFERLRNLAPEGKPPRNVYVLSFMRGKLFILVPESELGPELTTFFALEGQTGIVVPGCILYSKAVDELGRDFWRLVRDGNFRSLSDHPHPADVYRRYAYDPDKRHCYAVVRFDTRDTLRFKHDPLLIPDHLSGLSGPALGVSGVTLYEILSF